MAERLDHIIELFRAALEITPPTPDRTGGCGQTLTG